MQPRSMFIKEKLIAVGGLGGFAPHGGGGAPWGGEGEALPQSEPAINRYHCHRLEIVSFLEGLCPAGSRPPALKSFQEWCGSAEA